MTRDDIGKVNYNKAFGPAAGILFEYLGFDLVASRGLQCDYDYIKSTAADYKTNAGLNVSHVKTAKLADVFMHMKDKNTLYCFGNNMPGFDAFWPPNVFLQFANTLTDQGVHPLNYSAFCECHELLRNRGCNEFKVILVVPEVQESKWNGSLSFRFSDTTSKLILGAASNKGPVVRAYSELPAKLKEKLGDIKVYRGLLKLQKNILLSKRTFSTSASMVPSNYLCTPSYRQTTLSFKPIQYVRYFCYKFAMKLF